MISYKCRKFFCVTGDQQSSPYARSLIVIDQTPHDYSQQLKADLLKYWTLLEYFHYMLLTLIYISEENIILLFSYVYLCRPFRSRFYIKKHAFLKIKTVIPNRSQQSTKPPNETTKYIIHHTLQEDRCRHFLFSDPKPLWLRFD